MKTLTKVFIVAVALATLLAAQTDDSALTKSCIESSIAPVLGDVKPDIKCFYIIKLEYALCKCNGYYYIRTETGIIHVDVDDPIIEEYKEEL